jgi:hypothetical protein
MAVARGFGLEIDARLAVRQRFWGSLIRFAHAGFLGGVL